MKSQNFTRIIPWIIFLAVIWSDAPAQPETQAERDARMKWWREARFGLFIHWGLYAIPAGEWNGKTEYGEWIRTSAQIPLEEYARFVPQFNPVKFNAAEWVRLAKDAGMKYIVITSKHHDGFCLFDSKQTDFDVMSTPFQRDILKELSEACRQAGLKMCWYHSIMDWHHPDYLPRREWEKNRSTEGADFDRYVAYMKAQLKELLTNYGEIGVLWFDGEWESTWNTKYGVDLYKYVRSLQPNIIINNRVGAGRSGMEGFTKAGEFAGDFGTPEQQIPATGLPGVDWETCMTMNDHWGYNKHNQNWKSTKQLIQMLAEIASKGGNYLLNVGPTAEGVFPQASIDRLREIGQWMKVNSEAIYATQASPFQQLAWGRCTQKAIGSDTRLYLHVFDWPGDGKLKVPGIFNQAKRAYLLAAPQKSLPVNREDDALVVVLPAAAPDSCNSVVVLDIAGRPDVSHPPKIEAAFDIFVDTIEVVLTSNRENFEIRYKLNGGVPSINSTLLQGKIQLTETTVIAARCFRDGRPVSEVARAKFTKVSPRPAVKAEALQNGIGYAYFEGDWERLPNFKNLQPVKTGVLPNFSFSPRKEVERFGFEYTGFLRVPETGVYAFFTDSDDGSRLYIGDSLVVDNDGLHGMVEKRGVIALAAGLHPIRVTFFERTGGDDLIVSYQSARIKKQRIPDAVLFTEKQK
ncbi:MAG: alpha-L-fucosidase [candidate division KSB1 bacterium]|nr:alpha-L-fucosidase [candidate division KSB1 bacterium]MDZ7365575.1 alpha-L-fucosidase [candidate division KSB1 bacterium]MDZ7403677.1 alpha-L-fucosidase [candidate division KSB1 bacterium]